MVGLQWQNNTGKSGGGQEKNNKMSDQVGSEGQDVKLTANLCAPFDKIQWHKRGGFLLDEKSMFTKYSTDRGEVLY